MSERKVWLIHAQAAAALAHIGSNVFDALVTDPPAGVDFMQKDWDAAEGGREGFIRDLTEVFRETLRVLKPGAHGLVWALPRTSHWTATALEDAGFQIRDRIHDLTATDAALTAFMASLDEGQQDALVRLLESQTSPILHHLFLSGMPKGQGDIRRVLDRHFCTLPGKHCDKNLPRNPGPEDHLCPPSNEPLALAREGWSTGLKPTVEHWILVRKPLEGTQAKNQARGRADTDARWPRHAVLTHAAACREGACVLACPVALLDAQAGVRTSGANNVKRASSAGREGNTGPALGAENRREGQAMIAYGDTGAASRMFNQFQHDVLYAPKASVAEKERGLEAVVGRLMDTGRVEGSLGGNNPRNRGGKKRKNTHPCLPPGELVLTDAGWREIQTLSVGDMVYTNAGKYEPIADVSSHVLGDDRVYRLRVDGDTRTTRATGNHPFLVWIPERKGNTILGGRTAWLPAEEVRPGHYLMTPVWSSVSEESPYSLDYWWAAGLWLAEGSVSGSSNGQEYPAFSLHCEETDLVERLRSVWSSVRTYAKNRQGMTAVAMGPEPRAAVQHFRSLLGTGAREKHLSREVLSLPLPALRSFLDGYLAGDGATIRGRCRVKTASRRLAADLALAFPRAGYRCSLYWYDGVSGKVIDGRQIKDNGHWHLYLGDPAADKHKTKPLFLNHAGLEYTLRRVKSADVEPYAGLVWNLTMAGSPTFQTVVGMSHNTVKPIALMRHIIRMVTPPGGSVLDPYAGTGTTLIAARAEGCSAVGIERELEYVEIGQNRLRASVP